MIARSMRVGLWRRAFPAAGLWALWTAGALAQVYAPSRASTPADYPPVLPERRTPPPALALLALAERPLPGYPIGPPRLASDGAWLPLSGEWVRLESWPEPRVVPVATGPAFPPSGPQPQAGDAPWVVDATGRWRYRTRPEGWLEAQRKRRRGWKPAWELRVPAATLAPPLLVGERVVFGALDNQLYAVRADNGHRLWAADMGDRLSAPLGLWRGRASEAPDAPLVELVLVIPQRGARLLAVDAYDGRILAASEPPVPDSRWRPPPLVFPDGRIVALLEAYAAQGAVAVFHEVTAAAPASRGL